MNQTTLPLRDRRLWTDFHKVQKLANNSDFIYIDEIEGDPPNKYVIRFTCISVARLDSSSPVYSEHHRVLIELPANYPITQPRMRWLTPIFHPNINKEGTGVCIDVWYPTLLLDDLCLMLGRMIQYKNYNPYNALRKDAAIWSVKNAHLLPIDTRSLRRGESSMNTNGDFDIQIL